MLGGDPHAGGSAVGPRPVGRGPARHPGVVEAPPGHAPGAAADVVEGRPGARLVPHRARHGLDGPRLRHLLLPGLEVLPRGIARDRGLHEVPPRVALEGRAVRRGRVRRAQGHPVPGRGLDLGLQLRPRGLAEALPVPPGEVVPEHEDDELAVDPEHRPAVAVARDEGHQLGGEGRKTLRERRARTHPSGLQHLRLQHRSQAEVHSRTLGRGQQHLERTALQRSLTWQGLGLVELGAVPVHDEAVESGRARQVHREPRDVGVPRVVQPHEGQRVQAVHLPHGAVSPPVDANEAGVVQEGVGGRCAGGRHLPGPVPPCLARAAGDPGRLGVCRAAVPGLPGRQAQRRRHAVDRDRGAELDLVRVDAHGEGGAQLHLEPDGVEGHGRAAHGLEPAPGLRVPRGRAPRAVGQAQGSRAASQGPDGELDLDTRLDLGREACGVLDAQPGAHRERRVRPGTTGLGLDAHRTSRSAPGLETELSAAAEGRTGSGRLHALRALQQPDRALCIERAAERLDLEGFVRTEQHAIQQGTPWSRDLEPRAHGEGVRSHAPQGSRARLGDEVEPAARLHRGQIEDGLGEDLRGSGRDPQDLEPRHAARGTHGALNARACAQALHVGVVH